MKKIKPNRFHNIKPLTGILFHVGLGIVASIFRPAMLLYLFLVVVYFTFRIIKHKDKQLQVLLACAYIVGAEVYFRMTKAYLFYETGKYMVIFFCFLGILYLGFKKTAYPYLLYLLFLIPGVLVSYTAISYDLDFRKAVLFNLSGPLCLFVASMFCYGRTVKFTDFLKILDYIVYPLISLTVYVFLYNPDVRDIVTNTASNSALSGGYGPNQVATVLGLGFFILLTRFFIPYKNKLVHFIMMGFLVLMVYRGLLTFSRGGVLVGLIISAVFIFVFYFSTNLKTKAKASFKTIVLVGITLVIWSFTIFQTGGLIGNRYTNKDALGRDKGDITTGRAELVNAGFNAFEKNPFLGIGVGQVKNYFEAQLGVDLPAHNEISRLLSEHGMFGVFAILILVFAPIYTKMNGRKNIYFYPFLLFCLLTISHSAMRIATPAFIYALCLLNIDYETKKKPALYRK